MDLQPWTSSQLPGWCLRNPSWEGTRGCRQGGIRAQFWLSWEAVIGSCESPWFCSGGIMGRLGL